MNSTIKVTDLGPVATGTLELKPLTIFVGPNNSGKSHAALVVYAIYQALTRRTRPMRGFRTSRPEPLFTGLPESYDDVRQLIEHSLRTASLDQLGLGSTSLDLSRMPSTIKEILTELLGRTFLQYRERLTYELRRCYGSNLQELVRRREHPSDHQFTIDLTDDSKGLNWRLQNQEGVLSTMEWSSDLSRAKFESDQGLFPRREFLLNDADFFLYSITRQYIDYLLEDYSVNSYYLPANRSAILQAHKTLASLIVDRASMAWIEPLEVPQLPGVTTDLIQLLLTMNGGIHRGEYIDQSIVRFLEHNVSQGIVSIDSHLDYPDIYFTNNLGRFAFHTVSSMISEIAPLLLILKYSIRRGDLLIVEEPESHLDPLNQRNVARAIAMMVNSGINVVVTTHSDIFVNQINNLIQLQTVSSKQRDDMDYNEFEPLDGESIAVYLFRPGDDGTRVEAVEIDPDFGIPTESSDEIHRALYEEAIELEHLVSG